MIPLHSCPCCQCTIARLVFYTAVSRQCSLPVKITPVCMCQPLVIVSCTQCCLIVSPLFINTTAPECFSQALPGSSCSEALLLISTSTYTERLGFSWVDSALCFGFETKSLDVLQFLLMLCPSLIFPFSRITITFGVATIKNIIWFLFNRTVISCYTIQHNFFLLRIPEAATLSAYHCDLHFAGCEMHAVPQFP